MDIINKISIITLGENLSIKWAAEMLKHRGAILCQQGFNGTNFKNQILVFLMTNRQRGRRQSFQVKEKEKYSIFTFQITDSQTKGVNLAAQSSALISMGQNSNQPFYPAYLAETIGAIGLVNMVLLTIFENSQKGKRVELDFKISIGDLLKYHNSFNVSAVQNNLIYKPTGKNILDGGAPFYKIYKCAKNTNIALGNLQSKFYQQMVLGLKPYITQKQYELLIENQLSQQTWPQIKSILTNLFLQKTAQQWEQILSAFDTCATAITNHQRTNCPSVIHPNLLNKDRIINPKL